jgi:hypothetical protein
MHVQTEELPTLRPRNLHKRIWIERAGKAGLIVMVISNWIAWGAVLFTLGVF